MVALTGLLEWTGGMDWWNGLVEWTGGMDWWTDAKIIFTLLNIPRPILTCGVMWKPCGLAFLCSWIAK